MGARSEIDSVHGVELAVVGDAEALQVSLQEVAARGVINHPVEEGPVATEEEDLPEGVFALPAAS